MKKQLLVIAALAAGATLLSGCSAAGGIHGEWGVVDTPGEPSMVLEKDGSVHGSDGCNKIFGSYTANGKNIEFGELASTMMYCEDVDTWLNQAISATVSADTMTLFNETGEEIGSLPRAEQ